MKREGYFIWFSKIAPQRWYIVLQRLVGSGREFVLAGYLKKTCLEIFEQKKMIWGGLFSYNFISPISSTIDFHRQRLIIDEGILCCWGKKGVYTLHSTRSNLWFYNFISLMNVPVPQVRPGYPPSNPPSREAGHDPREGINPTLCPFSPSCPPNIALHRASACKTQPVENGNIYLNNITTFFDQEQRYHFARNIKVISSESHEYKMTIQHAKVWPKGNRFLWYLGCEWHVSVK